MRGWTLKISIISMACLLMGAKTSDTDKEVKLAQSIISKYWKADSVFMNVEKKVTAGILQTVTTSSGRLLFAKGELRMDFIKPTDQTVVINKDHIWLAKNTSKTDKKSWQVTKLKRTHAESNHALMALLFGDKKVWEKLKVISVNQKKDLVSIRLKPKNPAYLPGVVRLALIVDKATNELRLIKQWDDIENEIQLKFSNMLFDIAYEKNFFDYKPPKGAQITEI